MFKRTSSLLFFVVLIFAIQYLTVYAYATDNSTGNAITIDDIREKRGTPPISKNNIENTSIVENVKSVILTQTAQFLINFVIILVIILLLIFFKRKRDKVKSNIVNDKILVKVEGLIEGNTRIQHIEKPSLLEIIEKLFFPFFRRDIAQVNSQLSVLATRLDSLEKINEEQQIILSESMAHFQSILLSDQSLKIDKILTATESDKLLPYRLFMLGKSVQITKNINCSNEAFIKSAELSLSIEREFNLFNQIPLEYFAKKVTDKNIIAIGNWANLLIKHLGYGLSFKHSLLDAVTVSNDGEKIIPLSLIANNISNIESIIVTNQDLSSLILYSDNILERMKDNISESIIMPIEIVVPHFELEFIKFGGVERNNHGIYRWAVGFDDITGIKIYNNSHVKRTIEIRFSVVATTSGSSIIINGEKILIENNIEIVRTIELAIGENHLCFGFDGEKVKIGADPRELKFAIYNFSFDGNIIMNDTTVSTDDYNVRKRLHSVGFFEVEAEIVTNKGFFIEKLPTSKFLYSKDLHTVTDTAQFFHKYISEFNVNIFSVLYKGYRNEQSKN